MPSTIRRAKPLARWLSPREIKALHLAAARLDRDRPKLVRPAIRQKLNRLLPRHHLEVAP
jgi:hypothetical protein